jgi:tetratricopeptide (TPR) repeat protein
MSETMRPSQPGWVAASHGRRRERSALRLEWARQALNEGDVLEAVRLCRSILAREADHLCALEMQAHALWRLGRFAQVVRVASRLLALNPHEPGYLLIRGMAHMALGNYAPARESLETALCASLDPDFVTRVWEQLGDLDRLQLRQVEQLRAIDHRFAEAYARDPEAACSALGFAFSDPNALGGARPVLPAAFGAFHRPS